MKIKPVTNTHIKYSKIPSSGQLAHRRTTMKMKIAGNITRFNNMCQEPSSIDADMTKALIKGYYNLDEKGAISLTDLGITKLKASLRAQIRQYPSCFVFFKKLTKRYQDEYYPSVLWAIDSKGNIKDRNLSHKKIIKAGHVVYRVTKDESFYDTDLIYRWADLKRNFEHIESWEQKGELATDQISHIVDFVKEKIITIKDGDIQFNPLCKLEENIKKEADKIDNIALEFIKRAEWVFKSLAFETDDKKTKGNLISVVLNVCNNKNTKALESFDCDIELERLNAENSSSTWDDVCENNNSMNRYYTCIFLRCIKKFPEELFSKMKACIPADFTMIFTDAVLDGFVVLKDLITIPKAEVKKEEEQCLVSQS